MVLTAETLVLAPGRRRARRGEAAVELRRAAVRVTAVHGRGPFLVVDVVEWPAPAEAVGTAGSVEAADAAGGPAGGATAGAGPVAPAPWRLEFAPGHRRAGRRIAAALAGAVSRAS